ncbi:TonB-dependent receptor [Novosphingobium sp. G106]|uniref:TonB-dependent receptor n=1 Tax=Novosphingobium sp. G106 TaxID=2849500 RepID=UPI001C2D4972|nr:TonB-dependent receptor [Novosphingobium sp. G106]MBV1691893.1 TonB-dependent receptor [Novosphingobium sp. G106]
MQHVQLDSTSASNRQAAMVRALGAVSLLALGWCAPALAQDATPQTEGTRAYVENGDIIVTARKRQESILKVPVVVTAVSDQKLDSVQATQIMDLPKLVPGLVLGTNLLSIGPQVSLRGIGTSSYDPGVDQSVSLNIDGLSLGQGLAFGSGLFDVQQVEVLKGPQALFYGKSSPGGVISLRTSDPGDKLELIARAGYEIEGREGRGELIASGPVTDTLGLRLATTYSEGQGYFRNVAVPILSTGASAPYARETRPRNFIVRGTLLWKPVSEFSARLKVNHAYDHAVDGEVAQLANCPDGPGQSFGFGGFGPALGLSPVDPIPFIGGDNCKLDRNLRIPYLNPSFFPGIPNNGVPYLQNKQNYGTLELNYDLSPQLALTSTTAYYNLKSSSMVNPTHTTAAAPTFAVTNRFSRREFTQELRLNSDFAGPLNLTLGGFYENGRLIDRVHFIRNTAYGFLSPAIVGANILNDDRATTVDIKTYSLFGQIRYKLSDQLELAGGVRWTDETREERVFDYQNNVDITPFLPNPRVHSSNFSPEATITYTPTDDLTVFASYKKGYKSGSFKVAVPAVKGEDNSFGDEQVQGGETGIKARLADHSILTNVSGYYYTYKGLQVGGIADSVGGVPVITTVNAGKAITYGVDFDISYRPRSIEGLSLNASLNWNHARYKDLNNIPCIAGQTISAGCNQFFAVNANQTPPGPTGATIVNGKYGFYTAQDLSNTPMVRAPQWAANFGFDYTMPIGSGMKLMFTNNNQYSSKFVTFPAVGRPNNDNYQGSFIKVDAGLTLKDANDRWEVAVIGKNITDKITASNCSATNFAGGIALGGAITGGHGVWSRGVCRVRLQYRYRQVDLAAPYLSAFRIAYYRGDELASSPNRSE